MPIYNFGSNGSPIRRRPIYWFDGNGTPHEIEWGYWFDSTGTPHLVYGQGDDWLYHGGNMDVNPPGDEFNTKYLTGIDRALSEIEFYGLDGPDGGHWENRTIYSNTIVSTGGGTLDDPNTHVEFDDTFTLLPSSTIDTRGIGSIRFDGSMFIGFSVYGWHQGRGIISFMIDGQKIDVCNELYEISGDRAGAKQYGYSYTWKNTTLKSSMEFKIYLWGQHVRHSGYGAMNLTNVFHNITCNNQS